MEPSTSPFSQVTRDRPKTLCSRAYSLDEAGQRIKIDAEYDGPNPPKASTTYAYDSLHRLTRMDDNEAAWTTYTFDAAGNRLALSDQRR